MENNPLALSLEIIDHEVSQWIIQRASGIENSRTKFCAINSLRFLDWAHEIYKTSPIVACFAALNATEEAVVAFISAAKRFGHKEYARYVNLHDHESKALVSVFAQRCSGVAKQGGLGIAVAPDNRSLAFRLHTNDGYKYGKLHLSSFRISPKDQDSDSGNIALGDTPTIEELQAEVKKVAEARNKLLYATNSGVQSGFKEPQTSLLRETQLSLGLIWGAVDIYINPDQDRPFVNKVLEEMASLSTNGKVKG